MTALWRAESEFCPPITAVGPIPPYLRVGRTIGPIAVDCLMGAIMTNEDKLPQDVWEAVVSLAAALSRNATAEELVKLSSALRNARRRYGLTHDDVVGMLME